MTDSNDISRSTPSRSVLSKWKNALDHSQSVGKERVMLKKQQTLSHFRTTEGTGIVKQHISKWEKLFLEAAASLSQIKATIETAREQRRLKNMTLSLANTSMESSSIHSNSCSDSTTGSSSSSSSNYTERDKAMVVKSPSDSIACTKSEQYTVNAKPDVVISGSTVMYEDFMLGSTSTSMLQELLHKNNGKPVALLCGIYGEGNQPPVDLVTVLMEDDDGSIYIAVTIAASEGYEANYQAYGVKKLAIVSPEDSKTPIFERIVDIRPLPANEHLLASVSRTSYTEDEESGHDYEAVLEGMNPTGSPTSEAAVVESSSAMDKSIATATYPIGTTITATVTATTGTSTTTADNAASSIAASYETPVKDVVVSLMDDDISNTDDLNDKAGTSSIEVDAVEVAVESVADSVMDTTADISIKINNRADYVSDDDDDVDSHINSIDETPAFNFNFGRTVTLPTGRGDSVYYPAKHAAYKNKSWIEDDERLDILASAKHQLIKTNIHDIKAFSSSSNCFILQHHTENSTVVTGTLKSTITPSRCLVLHDVILEWTRGAAASGWLSKWPMKSQRAGRMTRRFFLLRDNILSYHKRKPLTEEAAETGFAFGINLSSTASVSKGRHFLIPCITVNASDDTLWMRCGNNATEQDIWIKEIRKGIAQNNKNHLFYTKGRLETIWHHESYKFSCVTVDGINSSDHYMHVALFVYDSTASSPSTVSKYNTGTLGTTIVSALYQAAGLSSSHDHNKPTDPANHTNDTTPTTTTTTTTSTTAVLAPTCQYTYSIDISFDSFLRHQLELQAYKNCINLSPTDIGSSLTCIKIFRSMILIGGSNGYVGIGVIDISTFDYGIVKCISASHYIEIVDEIDEVEFVGNNGHASSATVICLDIDVKQGIFASGDDQGVVSIWSINSIIDTDDNSTNGGSNDGITTLKATLISSINVCTNCGGSVANRKEKVKSIVIYRENYLLVSTNERLLCIRLHDVNHIPESWKELDQVLPGCEAIFSLSFDEIDGSITLWKVVGSDDFKDIANSFSNVSKVMTDSSIVYRVNWTDHLNNLLLNNDKFNLM